MYSIRRYFMSKKRFIKADDLYDFELINGPVISPDKKKIAFTKKWVEKETEKKYTNIYLMDLESKEIEQFTSGKQNDVNPRWSPDGKYIAFTSNRENEKKFQIYFIPTDGGEAKKITEKNGNFGEIAWGKKGKELYFTFSEKDEELKEMEKDEKKKKLGIKSRHIDRLFYKGDGQGFYPEDRMHIYKLNIKNKKVKQLTEDNKYSEGNIIISPDNKKIYFTSNHSENPDLDPMNISIFQMDKNGKNIKKICDIDGPKQNMSISPDGQYLSFVGHTDTDEFSKLSDLWIYSLENDKAICLTEEIDKNIGCFTLGDMGAGAFRKPFWSKDSKEIYFQLNEFGKCTLNKINIENKEITNLIEENFVVGTFEFFDEESKVIYNVSRMNDPFQFAVYDLEKDENNIITDFNKSILNEIKLGETEEIFYKGPDNNELQGWIIKPPDFDSSKKYPAILEIHGGPRAQYGWIFMHEFHYLAAKGYVVFFTNPRGGDGYGEKHMQAINNSWGDKDYADLMSWTELIVKKDYIDKNNIGVTGGSYGGYMTNWIIGHTDRFKAAVTQRSVSNFLSFWGSSDMNWLTQMLFGAKKPPWEDFENYWEQSPIKYMGNVKTPTMVIHSEKDYRCDIEQGEQVYAALKYQGIDTEFVRFPGEPHGLSRAGRTDRRIDRLESISGWFDKYMEK